MSTKVRRSAIVFIFILIQSSFAITGGFAALYFSCGDHISHNTYVGTVDIGDLSPEAAEIKLKKQIGPEIDNMLLTVLYNNSKEFPIKYSDVDVQLDYDATLRQALYKGDASGYLRSFLSVYLFSPRRGINSVFKVNEDKLKGKLEELAVLVDVRPSDAYISVNNGVVEKVPEKNGLKLNIQNSLDKLKRWINAQSGKPVEFSPANNYEIEETAPRITLKDFEGLDEVIAEYSTEISSSEKKASIELALKAIGTSIILNPADIKNGKDADVFSFNKCLQSINAIKNEPDEGYNQFVSTLYAAVLTAGIKADAISRKCNDIAPGYIEPGLDALVKGKETDFAFSNTLDSKLGIFSELKDNRLTIKLVSKKTDESFMNVIKTDIIQKYEPPIVRIENQNLARGQQKLVSEGQSGLKVNVYRIGMRGTSKETEELISTDNYMPVETVIQVGLDYSRDESK